MNLYTNSLYNEDIKYVADLALPWEKIRNKTILISGATGLVGSFLIDVILEKNISEKLNCTILALGRNEEKFKNRFSKHRNDANLVFKQCNIVDSLDLNDIDTIDCLFHFASNTHPYLYSTDPIGTITTNLIGVKNMLDLAVAKHAKRFVFASSNEVYGENRGDVEFFEEHYCGYIDCNTVRAGYPESKRCGESLCQAYKLQKGLDIIIPRITRSYGPTMLMSDTKAINQFIKNSIQGKDIVLKSSGMQYYSYTYVADVVSGLLTILFMGKNGEAYNIADENSDITLRDLAEIIAGINGNKVIFKSPDAVEAAGYSTATKARLDSKKIKGLGWEPRYNIKTGIKRTISILME